MADSELMLTDGIAALRRAINQRVRHLFSSYALRTIGITPRPRGTLELLQHLGLIKPMLLKRLIDVRNLIEHEDGPPPNKEVCAELSEFTWYFLRATDPAASAVRVAIGLTIPQDEDHFFVYDGWGLGIKLTTGPEEQWRIKIDAALPAELFSRKERVGWIPVGLSYMETRAEWFETNKSVGLTPKNDLEPYSLDDLFLKGEVGSLVRRVEIYRLYFAAI